MKSGGAGRSAGGAFPLSSNDEQIIDDHGDAGNRPGGALSRQSLALGFDTAR